MSDEPIDAELFPAGNTVTVGRADTETKSDRPEPKEPADLYDELAREPEDSAPGDEDTLELARDGGEDREDITSEPGPSDEEATRLSYYRTIGQQWNVGDDEMDSWNTADRAESYLRGVQKAMERYAARQQPVMPQQPTAPEPLAIPDLNFTLGPDHDEAVIKGFDQVKQFGAAMRNMVQQWQQERDTIASILTEVVKKNNEAVTMQRSSAMEAQIRGLEPEVRKLFTEPKKRTQLEKTMRVLELGRQAAGEPPLPYDALVRSGVNLIAAEHLKTIERDRLAARQKEKAKAAVPRVTGVSTADRDRNPERAAREDFSALYRKLAAKSP